MRHCQTPIYRHLLHASRMRVMERDEAQQCARVEMPNGRRILAYTAPICRRKFGVHQPHRRIWRMWYAFTLYHPMFGWLALLLRAQITRNAIIVVNVTHYLLWRRRSLFPNIFCWSMPLSIMHWRGTAQLAVVVCIVFCRIYQNERDKFNNMPVPSKNPRCEFTRYSVAF